jgi:hypothetical protein
LSLISRFSPRSGDHHPSMDVQARQERTPNRRETQIGSFFELFQVPRVRVHTPAVCRYSVPDSRHAGANPPKHGLGHCRLGPSLDWAGKADPSIRLSIYSTILSIAGWAGW